MEIKKIAAHYRQYLARMIKQSTRADYTKRLEMLVCYASMQGITTIEDIDFTRSSWNGCSSVGVSHLALTTTTAHGACRFADGCDSSTISPATRCSMCRR
nr:MAG TPA: hypothetical protein [Caudoviricetes sp.]